MRLPRTSSQLAARAILVSAWSSPWALADRVGAGTVVASGLTVSAALLWVTSLASIDPGRISDLGLITALPGMSFIALALLVAGFVVALQGRPLRQPLLAVSVVLLILMVHGVTSAIQEVPRFATTYVHAGFGEATMRTGDLFVNRDARFSWPVFFVLGGFLTAIAGLDNPIQLTHWMPALTNLAYVVPLWLIFRAFTVDRRLIWLAVWIFVAANWVGQDYYSPQGFNILLFLTILAITLTWFRSDEPTPFAAPANRIRLLIRAPHADGIKEVQDPSLSLQFAGGRAGLILVLVLLSAVVVSSHQLTPFAVFAGTGVLAVTRATILRGLPILVGVLLAAWLSYMTIAFLAGHLNSLLADALQAESVANAVVGERLRGTPGHIFIVYERIALSVGFWGIALLGGIRRFWNGHWDLSLGLLALGPFAFLGLQSYGGEMALRVYLFALPFMSFFVAGLFYPRLGALPRWQPILLFGVACLLIVATLFARYGNDRADMITADELAAAARAHAVVPAGSLIATANHNSPLGFERYESFERIGVVNAFVDGSLPKMVNALAALSTDRPAYLFLSRAQRAFFDLNGIPAARFDALVEQIVASPRFRLIFRTRDAELFEFLDGSAQVP